MRALWLHPVDAAERTAMMSPKSTYVEATSSRAVLKASLVLHRIHIIILQGYIKYQLHSVCLAPSSSSVGYLCLYCEFLLFVALVTTVSLTSLQLF